MGYRLTERRCRHCGKDIFKGAPVKGEPGKWRHANGYMSCGFIGMDINAQPEPLPAIFRKTTG